MKFRKKPVVIEAVQLNWKNWNAVCDFLGSTISEKNPARMVSHCSHDCGEDGQFIELTIPTLEGDHIAKHGDWIIKGINGEFYPCKPDIFDKTYEKWKPTERIVDTIQGTPSEIEYQDDDGNVIGYWAYGYFDPSYPYQEGE